MINNRPVGLWMLPAHVSASRGLLQREFNRLRTLEHPHIARMIELGSNGQQYYITGERLDGEPLRDVLTHLAPERLEVGEADDVVRAVGSALVYAHESDVAHGDVRAENVIVTMDRRVLLTNFLARRLSKASKRPPRPSDDLKGLARLAAELYTGSASPQALRAAAHSAIPAARLNAIRAVLEGSGRRPSGVAEFLDAAGLALSGVGATLRRPAPPTGSWWSLSNLALPMSTWRLVLPMAAVAGIASLIATYHGGIAAPAEELKDRGLDALRVVAARVTPAEQDAPKPAETDVAAKQAAAPAADVATKQAAAPAAEPPQPQANAPRSAAARGPGAAPHQTETPRDAPPPEAQPLPRRPASTAAARPATNKSPPPPAQHDLPVVSLDVPKIAAREDHGVVAIDIVRTGDTTHETRVIWWTTPDTAHAEDDYARTGRQTITFPPGATVERVLIPIVNDSVREAIETFSVQLAQPQGGVAGHVTTTRVTLYDDD